MTQTIAFRMQLLPGCAAEYKRRHDALWPQLADVLRDAGISNYRIYLDEPTGLLFATLRTTDPAALERLAENEIVRKWWRYMDDIMETNTDCSPVTHDLSEVFFFGVAT